MKANWPISQNGVRLAALERLLARGRHSAVEADGDQAPGMEHWLARAFGCDEPLAAGALSVLADGENAGVEPGDAPWLRADPIHLAIEREHATIVPSAALSLTREEAEALCETLNAHFAAELTIYPLHPERWCARAEGPMQAQIAPPVARSPLALARLPLKQHLPAGDAAKRWHGLLNETQMLLHDHPVNAAREARGLPAVNSLWFWGAGRLPEHAAARWRSVSADDPLARGLARRAGIARRELPRDAQAWLAGSPAEGVHLIVLDGLRAPQAIGDREGFVARLQEIDARWCAPLLAALGAGRIGMLTIHAPEAGLSFETTRGDLRRFWRRARPLERYAGRAAG